MKSLANGSSRSLAAGDEAENRIWDLVRNHFVRAAERDCGWTVLYRNPADGSFWELTLPKSDLQGGGPAKLNPCGQNIHVSGVSL
jgi:hypothetical protein